MQQVLIFAALYLAAINLVTWMAYWRDKRAAIQGRRRTSEVRLLTLAALGGSPAAQLAQQYYRHKTLKQPYRIYFQNIRRWQIRLGLLALIAFGVALTQMYMAAGR